MLTPVRVRPFLVVLALFAIVGCPRVEEPGDFGSAVIASDRDTNGYAGRAHSKFYFRLKYVDKWGLATLTINGFPEHQSGAGRTYQNPVLSIGLQSGLVRGENTVRIQVEPTTLRHGDALWFPTVRLHGQVTGDYHGDQPIPGAAITEAQVDSAYAKWKKRAEAAWARFLRSEAAWLEANPDRGWEITWRSGGALDSMWAWSRENPVIVSTTFENEAGPDFSDIFVEAPVLTDTVRIRDYAIYLRDRMAARDTLALFEAFRRAYADLYLIHPQPGSVEEDRDILMDAVVMDGLDLDFERNDIWLRKWSGGRVWQATNRGDYFFRAADSGEYREVFIAEIDGELQVVRRHR
jgi:hypothetical protein